MRRLILFMVLGLLLLLVYQQYRRPALARLRTQYEQLAAEQQELIVSVAELEELTGAYSLRADVPRFVESLYRHGRRLGLREVEVVSRSRAAMRPGTALGRRRRHGLDIQRLLVKSRGDFRQTAEFLRAIQEIEGPKRVASLTVQPFEESLQAVMELELYSLGVEDAK